MYELLVVVHILAGVAWVGGGFILMLGARTIRENDGHAAVDRLFERMEKAANYIFIPGPLLVLITGVTMVLVESAWSFSQTWVYLAIALFVASAILGGGVSGRLEKQMKEAREEGSVAAHVIDRYLTWGWVEMAILIGIVFVMVYKPI